MSVKLTVVTVVVLAATGCILASANAQTHHRRVIVTQPATIQPVVPNAPAVGTGLNTSAHNEPGVPNTSTPGIIGTGASPSGLPGDSTSAPGFPATVGRE